MTTRTAKFVYRRQVYDYTTNREVPQDNVYHYRRPEDVGFVKYLSETNVYNYFHYRRENDYFHYGLYTTTSFVKLDPL